MWLLGKRNVNKLAPILHSEYYTKWVNYFKRLLRLSRQKNFYEDPVNLLGLELALVKNISQGESLVSKEKELKKKAKKRKNYDLIEDLEIGINNNRHIVRIAKVIADGLAWRVLDYDRPFLRIMSESKKYFGSAGLSLPSYRGTERAAIRLVSKRGSRVLLNDITNFLRLGDLVEVGKKTEIYEVKKSGKTSKSVYSLSRQTRKEKASKQLKQIIPAQIVRDFRRIIVGNEVVKIRELPLKFKNNLKAVSDLINQSRKNLYAYAEFGNYLAVSCTDNEQMIEISLKTGEKVWRKHRRKPRWSKSDFKMPFSNLDYFFDYGGDFLRNSTPYSIYPLSISNCMGLISGKLFLVSQLNISEIKRLFIKKNWQVIDVDIDEMLRKNIILKQRLFTGRPYENIIDDTMFVIKRGSLNLNIPWYWVTRIATEFMKPEVLLEQAELIYQQARPREKAKFFPFILGEKEVWR